MENKDYIKVTKISDLFLASTLLCLDFNVMGIDDTNPKRVFFYFDSSLELDKTITSYWNDGVSVNPKLLNSYRRELLSRIKQGERVR